MNPILRLLEDWSTHQDYFWFLALLAWGGVLGAEFRRKEDPAAAPADHWLVALAGSAMLGALLELFLLAQDLQIPYARFDAAMGFAQAAGTFALVWGATSGAPQRSIWRAVTAVALVGLVVARVAWPVEAGFALCAIQAAAVLGLIRQSPRPISVAAAVWLLAGPVIATHGPWAYAVNEGRRITDWSHFSLPAASVSLLAGATLAIAAWRRRLLEVSPSAALLRDVRRALLLLAAWLMVGVLLAVWYGRQARRAYEENLLRRVNMATLALDMNVVADALSTDLRVERVEVHRYPDGRPVSVAITPRTTAPVYATLRAQLQRVRKYNPDLNLLDVAAWRQGHLLMFSSDPIKEESKERVVARDVTPADLQNLAQHTSFLEGPVRQPWGAYFLAEAPLIHPNTGQVLGWLTAEVDATRWAVTFTQARLQTMALVAAGVGLWTLAVAYRLRREARDAAERKAASAAAADRTKSAFLAKVSHELRTPLQSLLGYSELLEQAELAPQQHAWVAALHSHGAVMLRLVNDLIDLGSLQAGVFRLQPGRVNLPQLVTECVTALQPRAGAKGLQLVHECAANAPGWVEADAVRLRQILLNLATNAVKYTERGSVRLTLARGPAGGVRFSVRDTGPGIPEERRAELFRPFTRLTHDEHTEGSGVGLALVAGLCAAMGGSVRLENPPGGGSLFVVDLALTEITTADESPAAELRTSLAGLRIVVADDNTLVRELLTVSLRERGAEVVAVADGEEAVAACAQATPDAVVLDLAMPRLDGFGAARAIRASALAPQPFLVGLSAHAQVGDEVAARAAGMDHFLTKPVRLATLASVLRSGRGPAEEVAPPEEAPPALVASLRAHYERETPLVLAEMRAAFAAGDWPVLRRRAHYLKNSADVLGLATLQDACRHLSLLADPPEPAHAEHLLAQIEATASLDFMLASESHGIGSA